VAAKVTTTSVETRTFTAIAMVALRLRIFVNDFFFCDNDFFCGTEQSLIFHAQFFLKVNGSTYSLGTLHC
jgi:hypothetical protein